MCMVNRGIFFNFKKRFTLTLCGPYYGTHVEIREELVSIGSFLPSGFQGSNPGHQSWWQMFCLKSLVYLLSHLTGPARGKVQKMPGDNGCTM